MVSLAVSTIALIPKKIGTVTPAITISTMISTHFAPPPPFVIIGGVVTGVPPDEVSGSPYCTFVGGRLISGVGSGSVTGGVTGGVYCWNVGFAGGAGADTGGGSAAGGTTPAPAPATAASPRVIRSISPTVPAAWTSWIRFSLSTSTIWPRAAASLITLIASSRSLSLAFCPQSATC